MARYGFIYLLQDGFLPLEESKLYLIAIELNSYFP